MSHTKNVEAFGKLTGICTGYGGGYNPGKQNLQVEAMSALMNNARQVMDEVRSAQTELDNVTNTRESGFKDIQRFGTRIISALKASGAGKLTIEDARASVRKLVGKKTVNRLPVASEAAATPKPKTRTARGLDFATMADHFAQLVETISAEASYHPNEPELSVTGLSNMLTSLRGMNEAVQVATAQLNNARKKRNALLYSERSNLLDTATAAKHYVRAAFGPESEQNMEVKRIRFTKPNR